MKIDGNPHARGN